MNRRVLFPLSVLVMLILTVGVLGNVLLTARQIVPCYSGKDLFREYVHSRHFGFTQLAEGNLPLWNPHIFSGTPFVGGFQSAMLYPPNLLYLVFPLHTAINIGIALHVLLGGVFMYLWAWRRGLHPAGRAFCGVLFMFCGAHFPHIFAGHLSNLCAMAWAPLLFLAIDGMFDSPRMGWSLLGVFAVGMQILAGHPQYVFYTGVAAVIYAGLQLGNARHRLRIEAGLVGMYAGAIALTAVQLFVGLDAASESVRAGGISYKFAGSVSFPPKNFLTLLAPGLFGDLTNAPYWGQGAAWEISAFIGVTGVVLGVLGCFHPDRRLRRFCLPMVIILAILALGSHTPLFRMLHAYVPGFNKFRGASKFIFQMSLFLIMLAGIGLDRLIKVSRMRRSVILTLLGGAVILGIVAAVLFVSSRDPRPADWWRAVMKWTMTSAGPEPIIIRYAPLVQGAAANAAKSLFLSSVLLAVLGALVYLRRYSRKVVYLVMVLGATEVVIFAVNWRSVSEIGLSRQPGIEDLLKSRPGDHRTLYLADCGNPNEAMSMGTLDMWGWDPGVLRRYAEFMYFTQGANPDAATQDLVFHRPSRLFSMLRGRFGLAQEGRGTIRLQKFIEPQGQMKHLNLIHSYRVIEDRNAIFRAMSDKTFDPHHMVILESSPDPPPAWSSERESITVRDSSTDHLTVEADLSAPAILLITDSYSAGWRAWALPGSDQTVYRVMPANYILRAIPLSAGHHVFRLEYLPRAFVIGKWISISSLIVYMFLLGLIGWKTIRRRTLKDRAIFDLESLTK